MSGAARVSADADKDGRLPSQKVIEDDNPVVFKPRFLVLDDINIDLITVFTITGSLFSILVLGKPWLIVSAVAAAILTPLRLLFPMPSTPRGLTLITGASSGIGAEFTYIFARKGHDVILVGRDEGQLDAVAKNVSEKHGRKAHIVVSDLSVIGSAKKLYDHVTSQGLEVDVLVNDAGLGASGDTMEMPLDLVERMTTLNCISLVQLTQLFGSDMIKRQRGWILNVSSTLGWMASPGQNLYHATKHFVRAFSEDLSIEMRAYPNIVLTQLMPGPVRTQFITRSHAEETFIFAGSGTVEEPSQVAEAGYDGLCKRKRMVFSSWASAGTALMFHFMPRSLHLTLTRVLMAPTRGVLHAREPDHDQEARGASLAAQ
jgi:uncharacterized protein